MKIHLIVLGLLLVALLMSTGVGYSMWASRLRVNVNIHMADDDKPFIDSYKGFICCETSCCDHDHCHHGCNNCNSNALDDNSSGDLGTQCHHCHPPTDCNCKGLEDDQISLVDNSRTILLTNLECEDNCHCCCHDNHDDDSIGDPSIQGTDDIGIQCHHCCHDCSTNMSIWVGLVIKHEGEVPVRLSGVEVTVNGAYNEMFTQYFSYGPFTTSFQQYWGYIDPCNLPLPGYHDDIVLDNGDKMILFINVKLTNTSSISSIAITPVFTNWNE